MTDKQDKSKWENVASSSEEPLAITHPSSEELMQQLSQAEEKLAKMEADLAHAKNDLLRAHADMDNVQKRAQRKIEESLKFGLGDFVNEIIPVLDSLYHSLELLEEGKGTLREGNELTLKMFLTALSKFGVKEINPVGETYNPAHHDAILVEENTEVEPNKIIKVFQRGYLLNDRLLRPARVVVSKKGP